MAGLMLLAGAGLYLYVVAMALRFRSTPMYTGGRLKIGVAGFIGFICLIIGDWQIRHEPGTAVLAQIYAWGAMVCFIISALMFITARTIFIRVCFLIAGGAFLLSTCVNLAF